jgi:hypothetical protein
MIEEQNQFIEPTTIEEAIAQMNEMFFPAVEEGDIASLGEFKMIYTSGQWVEHVE